MSRFDAVRTTVIVALLAAAVAGVITGTQLTIEDEAWPGRGGVKAVLQMSMLFATYAFAVALPVGLLLWLTLSRALKDSGAPAHVLAGAAIGGLVHILVCIAIRERIDGSEDFLGGTAAGAAAGWLWGRVVSRKGREVIANG